ncbi:hypothetical protein [Mycobacterium sp. 94-17]|uniref:hypothetical protein n=1 Tax=Mycobacterium sp. 94-17 TaxID=2986147 RepID=UPI002D1EC5B6|nr:hypothetical protein [Mycobacterium sp. 94-17]MEB4210612.1 hypothetical protein [Mycobacterium sp. 94-17]
MNDVEEQAIQGRKHAIYALTAFCFLFFGGWIVASYAVALHYGYGTGIGDGVVKPIGPSHGHGFLGDLLILAGNAAVVGALLYCWHWLQSRLEAITADDPLPPDDGADLSKDANWYYIQIPGLTKFLVAIAAFCTVGVSVLMAAVLPVVLLRFGW